MMIMMMKKMKKKVERKKIKKKVERKKIKKKVKRKRMKESSDYNINVKVLIRNEQSTGMCGK